MCRPSAYAIADDYANAPTPWVIYNVRTSNARPSDNKWGDYNTVRRFYPSQGVWVAAGHYIPGSTDCANCAAPVFFAFGRERDTASWNTWRSK